MNTTALELNPLAIRAWVENRMVFIEMPPLSHGDFLRS